MQPDSQTENQMAESDKRAAWAGLASSSSTHTSHTDRSVSGEKIIFERLSIKRTKQAVHKFKQFTAQCFPRAARSTEQQKQTSDKESMQDAHGWRTVKQYRQEGPPKQRESWHG